MAPKASKKDKQGTQAGAGVQAHGICPALMALAVPVGDLTLDPKNARKHGDRNLGAIAKSLEAFGQQKPIVVDMVGKIIAGNGTYQTAVKMGWSHIAAVRTEMTDAQAAAFAIADNQTAALAEWDPENLAATLEWLKESGEVDVSATGFTMAEIEEFITDENDPFNGQDPDEAPGLQKESITQLGDMWAMGEHRLMCGDATDPSAVGTLVAGGGAAMALTDPPYNVAYEGKTKDALTIQNDKMGDAPFLDFLNNAFFCMSEALKPGGVFYIWHADSEGFNFRSAVKTCGLKVRQCLIWNKNILVMGRQDYHWKHEPCLYGWKDGDSHYWGSDRKQTTVLDFNKPTRNGDHPTMKPVDLFAYQIENSSKRGDIVLDTFGGSGTTMIACEKTGRIARLMELDPKYCDVICRRFAQLTGTVAVRQDGVKFSELEKFDE